MASYYFYMAWKPAYIILIIISTLIDYFAGIMMGRTDDKKKRKKYLILSLVSNLSLLFLFKYFNFFNDSAKTVLEYLNIPFYLPQFRLLLPMGISFYTFQTMSYSIDVYKGVIKPEKHLGIFSLYVTFFPQLVAGPIERSENLLPQFREKHDFDYDLATNGLKLIAWGLFKKVVIADRVAILVNTVYNNVHDYTGFPLILATILFAFQIYCDFSGYSDIAIGSAQFMGYRLMENFRRPYFAKSISEFWRRWHISLSTWFKDYIYIPLGGNRVSKWKWQLNLATVFLISGLWHGANWTFVVWGAIHGFYQIFSIWTSSIRKRIVKLIGLDKIPTLHNILQITITFALVCFGWIFFRANNISDAIYVIKNMFINIGNGVPIDQLGLDSFQLKVAFLSIGVMELVHLIQEYKKKTIREIISTKPIWIRWSLYYILVLWIILLGTFGSQEFIYFQF
ncbi:MBOAT family protein [Tissierella pigra]|uniref:MBOAT family O-acyltransferase n=1 Tax=Tissierella pigra TaxID=2607614 RepID=UPI001C11C538|nr:MBOAT family O-acyltransferase [Tissierella pigra]MBU5427903.1 MBOAT family protein [Tissierella pigra]